LPAQSAFINEGGKQVADEDDARWRDHATQVVAAHFITKDRLIELPLLLRAA
jgi:hypothetical protein